MDKEKQKVLIKAAIALAVLVIVYLILRSRQKPVVQVPGELSPFQAPYYYTNVGIVDPGANTNWPDFYATNNINVNANDPNGLSRAYIPMFGLVGMTAVSGS